MPFNREDSDMKIVGKENEAFSDGIDADAFLEETGRQHFNGNMAKARALGSDIVSAFSYKNVPDEICALIKAHGLPEDDVLLSEIRILNVFCAEYSMDEYLPSALLSTASAAEMFDVLQDMMPEFYDRLSHSASFSFYYMCIKNGGDLKRRIGEAFAEMCDDPKNEELIAFAGELFERNVGLFKKAIRGYAFV